jgi:hypothetical protein
MIVDLKTRKFVVKDVKAVDIIVLCDLVCPYSQYLLLRALEKRPWCTVLTSETQLNTVLESCKVVQFRDFENIAWEPVMRGSHSASSYLVRKGCPSAFANVSTRLIGLSRKAQMSLQLKKYLSKRPSSALSHSLPFTLVVDTWPAFDDMRLSFGIGQSAVFRSHEIDLPFRSRIEWALEDVYTEFSRPDRSDWIWILKPSVTNKSLNGQ